MEEYGGKIQEKLEREVVQRLTFEWKWIHHDLKAVDYALASRLSMPSIVIQDMNTCLGQWVKSVDEIRLSRTLVTKGRWDSVCEVLRHEVAHQMADTFPGQLFQSPHGEIFRACCRKIQANPRASGSYHTLEERVWGETRSEPDKIMLKVKKLMGLASSKNRFEAASAAAKANELISRYNIDMIRHDKPRDFESIIITDPVLKRSQAALLASVILREFYFVATVWISTFMPRRGKVGQVLEITGTVTNIKIADYVFHYILQYAEFSWREYKKLHPTCRSRSGYMTGVVAGFKEKLGIQKTESIKRAVEDQQEAQAQELKALTLVTDKRLARHFQLRHPRMRMTAMSHSSASRSAYESGMEQGRHLNVSKGISSHGGSSGRFIGQS